MKHFSKFVLGAAIVAGGLGLGATSAQAAEFRVVIGGPGAYVPPCPGPGYIWAAGYYSDGYWIPGRWNYVGRGYVQAHNRFYVDRRHDRDYFYRDTRRHDRDDRRHDRDDHYRR